MADEEVLAVAVAIGDAVDHDAAAGVHPLGGGELRIAFVGIGDVDGAVEFAIDNAPVEGVAPLGGPFIALALFVANRIFAQGDFVAAQNLFPLIEV